MSQLSHKARMREALLLTEGNLSSLIGVRYRTGLTEDSNVDVRILTIWRGQVRRALGHFASGHVTTDALSGNLMREFYLSPRYYNPKTERPADNIQAAIKFALDRFDVAEFLGPSRASQVQS